MDEQTKAIEARAKTLQNELNYHNHLYHVETEPEISDIEFDALLRELKEIEDAHPEFVTSDSPTQKVGGKPLDGFERVQHIVPMLSIDNTYNADDLRDFDERVKKGLKDAQKPAYVVELKVDGVAMSLRYEKGRLTRATTRGDGYTGDDVTRNIKRVIAGLPQKLKGKPPEVLEVRGEVFMRNEELKRLNGLREKRDEAPLANPRNTTAGTLKLLNPKIAAERRLNIFVYDIVPTDGVALRSHTETLDVLKRYGFPVNEIHPHCESIDAVLEVCREWEEKRSGLGYETDGMVVKVDSAEHRVRLGATSRSPRWIIAYKFPAQVAQSRLKAITVQVGKSGALTPVAEVAPVRLAGTEVRRASLYNFEDLERKDLRVGDTVEIQKAGEIIPQILRYIPEKRPPDAVRYHAPAACPVCDGEVRKDPDGAYLRCLNLACPAQVKERLEHFASRKAMDIDGLGPGMLEKLMQLDLVHDPADLYELDVEKILALCEEKEIQGLGKISVANLIKGIEASKNRTLSRLLNGLGIRHVGDRGAEVLASHFGSMDALIAADVKDLVDVHEIGDVVAATVLDFFDTPENRELIARLKEHRLKMTEDVVEGERPLDGKTVVVTGTLSRYTRDSIRERIKALGGRASTSLSAKTDYLVAGDKAGSKLAKAEKLGVTIMTEAEFETLSGI